MIRRSFHPDHDALIARDRATVPEGLGSIATTAIARSANGLFVLAVQTLGLFVAILTLPPIAHLTGGVA